MMTDILIGVIILVALLLIWKFGRVVADIITDLLD